LKLPLPSGLDGRSLLPLLETDSPKMQVRKLFSQAYKVDTVAIRKGFLKAMVTWPTGAEAPSRIEVYNLATDAGEHDNLADDLSSLTEDQKELVSAAQAYFHISAEPQPASEQSDLSDEQKDRLQALGYVE